MASAPQSGQSGDSGKRQALIGVNDLNYVLPPDLSVSVVRTHTNHYFQQSEYTDKQRAICILNTGAHYIDARQSSLEFGVRLNEGAIAEGADAKVTGWFGKNGSALNLIDSITITSRAGDELCRLDQADLLHYVTVPYRNTQGWCDTVGSGMGLNTIVSSLEHNENTRRFSIPLYALVDFFNYGRLIPPMLASGLRISITWTAPGRAFIARTRNNPAAASGVIRNFTIENPYISTFAHQLSDGIQRDLNELSATNGLEIVYTDWEPTEITYASSSDLSAQLEVRKAASRALQAIAVTRNSANINLGVQDSYATSAFDYAKYQWQLGSLYFPQQPVIANGTVGATGTSNNRNAAALNEAYKHTLISFGTYKPEGGAQTSSAVNFRTNDTYQTDPTAAAGLSDVTDAVNAWGQVNTAAEGYLGEQNSTFGKFGTFSNGLSVIGVQLERTDLFNMSGVPINNARVLSLRTTYRSTNTALRTLTVFLKYVRLARCFLNNVEVEQ